MITPKNLDKAYQNFFVKDEAGQYFLHELDRIITTQHELAEKDPNLSRDYVQRAKGAREVLSHINSVTAEQGRKTPN